MQAYVYNSEIYCPICATTIIAALTADGGAPSEDSGTWPQGPYPDGGGEADTPTHCGKCDQPLGNPLTSDGWDYVRERLREGTGNLAILGGWAARYGIPWFPTVDALKTEFYDTTDYDRDNAALVTRWLHVTSYEIFHHRRWEIPDGWRYHPGASSRDPNDDCPSDPAVIAVRGATDGALQGFFGLLLAWRQADDALFGGA